MKSALLCHLVTIPRLLQACAACPVLHDLHRILKCGTREQSALPLDIVECRPDPQRTLVTGSESTLAMPLMRQSLQSF